MPPSPGAFFFCGERGPALAWASAQETAKRVGAARLQGGVEAPGQRGSFLERVGRGPQALLWIGRGPPSGRFFLLGERGAGPGLGLRAGNHQGVGAARSQKCPPGAGLAG